MRNPANAVLLYLLVVISAVVMTPRWAAMRAVLQRAMANKPTGVTSGK